MNATLLDPTDGAIISVPRDRPMEPDDRVWATDSMIKYSLNNE
jgi:hypothetical protein